MTDSRTQLHDSRDRGKEQAIAFTGRFRYTCRHSREQANNSDKARAKTGFGTQVIRTEIRQTHPTWSRRRRGSVTDNQSRDQAK